MIRTILLSTVLGGALAASAPTAEAGDLSLIFGIGDRHGNSVRVRIGDRNDRRVVRAPSHRGHRHEAPRYRVVTERVWVPGHYDTETYEVRIPGGTRRVKVPARYEWRVDSCGHRYRVLVQAAHYETVCEPDRIETRTRKVFHPGYYETQTRTIRC